MNNILIYFLFFLFISPIVIFGLPTFLILFAGFVPAFVAFAIDKEKERACTVSVFYANACGILPQMIHLWHGSHTLEGALILLSNPYVWLMMYGAAGVGWGIYLILPMIISKMAFIYGYYRIKINQQRQKEILKEWGEEIKK